MYPAWDLQYPLLEILLKHQSLRIAAFAIDVLFLGGLVISCFRLHLLEVNRLKRNFQGTFIRVFQFMRRRFPYLLASAGLIAGIVLATESASVLRSHWTEAPEILFQMTLNSPIIQAMNLTLVLVSGLALRYAKSVAMRRMAGIALLVGMAIGAINFLSINDSGGPPAIRHPPEGQTRRLEALSY